MKSPILWTAETYKTIVGYEPEQDDLARINCSITDTPGHTDCGLCKHNYPKFLICPTCKAEKKADFQVLIDDTPENLKRMEKAYIDDAYMLVGKPLKVLEADACVGNIRGIHIEWPGKPDDGVIVPFSCFTNKS